MERLRAAALHTLCALALLQVLPGYAQRDAFLRMDREVQDHARGFEWLSWSTAHIGHRLTGSPNGAQAEAFADSLLRSFGMDHVLRFPFRAKAWARGRVQLTVGDGQGFEHLEAVALANTPGRCAAEAELLDVGNGLQQDLDRLGDALRGKAALVNIGLLDAPEGMENLHRSEKTALLMERGAAAVVFVNNVDGCVLLTGTASVDGSTIPVPAVCVASEDGQALRERLAAGQRLTLRVSMDNQISEVEAHNVIGELRGTELPDEVVIVGGHLDSWDLATGATDNGLGAFSILDMARLFTTLGIKPRRTLRFVLFMGEEQGLLGSRALVEHYRESGEIQQVRCMVNLDMSADPRGFGVVGPEGWAALIAEIAGEIRAVDSLGFKGEVAETCWLHSDHQPFLLQGVPVLYPLSDLGKHVYGCYHSSCDDIHLVEPRGMMNNARFVGMLLLALADAETLPAGFSDDALRERLISSRLEEKLRIGGDWRW